jgi:NADP-dependent 3-hydroxy acid dehydrogenase YdfG
MVEPEFPVVRLKGDEGQPASVYQGMKPLSAEQIAETAWWCINRPAHVNIKVVEPMPVQQAPGVLAVHRG